MKTIVKAFKGLLILIIFIFGVLIIATGLQYVVPLSIMSSSKDRIINAKPTSSHPLTGFYRDNWFFNFGVLIEPVSDKLYSISFCGPGGCFEKNKWTCPTTIYNDSNYEVINSNEINFINARKITKYKRDNF